MDKNTDKAKGRSGRDEITFRDGLAQNGRFEVAVFNPSCDGKRGHQYLPSDHLIQVESFTRRISVDELSRSHWLMTVSVRDCLH